MNKKLYIMIFLLVLGNQLFATARDDMKYIDQLYKAKEYNIAIGELRTFLNKYPKSSYNKIVLDRLAKTLYITKNYRNSIVYFQKYLNLKNLSSDEKNDVYYYLSKNYIYLNNYNESKKMINLIDKKSNRKIDAVYFLGVSYYNIGAYKSAISNLKLLLNSEKTGKNVFLYLALSSYNVSEYTQSENYLNQYITGKYKNKNMELANYTYGMSEYQLGNIKSAISKLSSVESNFPNGSYLNESRNTLLKIYLSLNSKKKAIEYYNKLILNGKKYDANIIVADQYFEQNDYKKALKYYQQAGKLSKSSDIYRLGLSMLKLGELEKNRKLIDDSKIYFKRVIKTDFDSEGIYYISYIDFKEKNYKEVIYNLGSYNRLKMKAIYRYNIDLFLGKSYFELKNYKKSELYYKKAYSKKKSVKNLYQLILVSDKLKDLKNIKLKLSLYKSKFPNDTKYKQKIYLIVGNAYYRNGQPELAKDIYEEYLKEKNDVKISENLITVFLAEGEYKDLIVYLDSQPITVENRYLYGISYLGLVQYKKAIVELNFVINSENATTKQKEKSYYNLIKAYFGDKNYEKTIMSANNYLSNDKNKNNRYKIIDLKGLAYFRLNKYRDAINIFTDLGKNRGYEDYSAFQIAEIYYNQQQYDNALSKYDAIYKKDINGKYAMKSLYWEINILSLQKQYKKVIEKSSEFIKTYAKSDYVIDVNFYKAQAYYQLKNINDAIKTYVTIYQNISNKELKDKTARELTNLYLNNNDYKNAHMWSSKISNKDEIIYLKGIIFEKENKMDLAVKEYMKIVESKDYGSKANFNLANYFFKKKNYVESQKYYENILMVENGPYKDIANYELGNIYLKKRDYNRAISKFMKIDLLYKKSDLREASIVKLATIYQAQKQNSKAKKTYEAIYKNYPNGEYRSFVLEKLLVICINDNKIKEGTKYYQELLKTDKAVADNYSSYYDKIIKNKKIKK